MAEHEPMVEVFIYETRQFLEQLEQMALTSEQEGSFTPEDVNEIFRAMHTIKGSAAMMMLDEISKLAHAVEDEERRRVGHHGHRADGRRFHEWRSRQA
ncbi:Hpt domain-containing protein [uncultured Selenomonas sp.]|uniref:Hpt domain-containing protein n=1 Tax=uncultured Selenomonas sp. TaxID=159275 RepID=UPI0025FF696C|nr:Hpt domain-containing protein [uncultured Selenomonas sp.]